MPETSALRWTGGDARYLYVLDADSQSPGVPPNLDLPEGTLWRIDVAPTAVPIESGVTYGVVPEGASQAFPEGAPAPLAAAVFTLPSGCPVTKRTKSNR